MPLVNPLITLDQAKLSIFNTVSAPSGSDEDITDYISAATPVIEAITGPVYKRDEIRALDGGRHTVVLPFPFNSVSLVSENDIPITDYIPAATAGVIYAGAPGTPRCFAAGEKNITVIVSVGFTAIPPNIQLATRELVRFWWQQGRQGNRPAFGDEAAEVIDVPSGFAVPRRVVELCTPNRTVDGFA